MLASLFNVPRTDRELAQFSFANNDEHIKIATALQNQKGIYIPSYILDPILPENKDQWLNAHQDIHNYIDNALGIVGNDLSEVDFNNPGQVASWIWLHAQEHYQAANILGLT